MSDSLWPHGQRPTRFLSPWDFLAKNTGVGCHSLLQGIFPTQGLNPGLLQADSIPSEAAGRSTVSYMRNQILLGKNVKIRESNSHQQKEFDILKNDLFYCTTLYWFCHSLTWIYHGCTCASILNPPPHPIPQGHPSAPVLGTLSHASNLDWWFISHMIIYMFQCHFPKSSHPCPLPQSPKTILHICVSFAVLHIGLLLPSF